MNYYLHLCENFISGCTLRLSIWNRLPIMNTATQKNKTFLTTPFILGERCNKDNKYSL